jgi:hypothetical protein
MEPFVRYGRSNGARFVSLRSAPMKDHLLDMAKSLQAV